MPIVDQINRDLTEAMKAREAERLSALRMVKTALTLRETELPGAVDDSEAMKVLNTLLKQRRDAADQFRAGGREELALKEENEARIIQTYLPAAASEEDISRAVEETIAELGASSMKDMGAVMKAVRPKLEGKTVDGKALSDLVKAKLSAVSGQ
ncbi:MAG: GatB/YqeY domain-containing protein [Acidobacteriota bacterium]